MAQTDNEILLSLPTAPRARAPGEEPGERRLGGGFGRDYGERRELAGAGPALPSDLLLSAAS